MFKGDIIEFTIVLSILASHIMALIIGFSSGIYLGLLSLFLTFGGLYFSITTLLSYLRRT